MNFDSQTWQTLLDAVYEMNAADTHADFADAVIAGLAHLVEADVIVFQVLDRTTQRILVRSAPPDVFTDDEIAYYTAHSDEMPLVAHFASVDDPSPCRISDLVDDEAWLASDYYRNCLARRGLARSLALPVAVDATTVVAVSFDRTGPDFAERDCALLSAFAPHLRLSWQRHEAPWAQGPELAARRSFRELGLSPRESEVLYWMTEGRQNREIATMLGISIGTVQEHVANLLVKLEQPHRHAATVYAIHHLHAGRREPAARR
ncbi:MAG TPA: LuxR C-terminal-related transcriptional regulator [Microbacteriaceae bacterium]|nr:LuxR C-terminal-related transcriptional regulator [Microbacteriaceae bacterium]